MKKGEYAKAVRFFEKSYKLFPLPGKRVPPLWSRLSHSLSLSVGVSALRDKAEALANGGGASASSSSENFASSSSSARRRPTAAAEGESSPK